MLSLQVYFSTGRQNNKTSPPPHLLKQGHKNLNKKSSLLLLFSSSDMPQLQGISKFDCLRFVNQMQKFTAQSVKYCNVHILHFIQLWISNMQRARSQNFSNFQP